MSDRQIVANEPARRPQWVICPVCGYDGMFIRRDGASSCSRCAFRVHNERLRAAHEEKGAAA